MFRIDHTSNANALPTPGTAGTAGYFTEGDAQLGVEATVVTADWLNQIQEELVYLLTKAAVTPSKSNYTQIYTALANLFKIGGTTTTVTAEPADRSDVSVDVTGVGHLRLNYAAGADIHITALTGGVKNQLLVVTNIADSADVTVYLDQSSDLRLGAGRDTVLTEQQTVLLCYDNITTNWREVAPTSANIQTFTYQVTNSDTNCSTGEHKGFAVVPPGLDGWTLQAVTIGVTTPGATSGTMDVQIVRRGSGGAAVDMLTTKTTLAVDEYFSSNGVPDPDYNRVNEGDRLYVDVDAIHGTAAKGLSVGLTFHYYP